MCVYCECVCACEIVQGLRDNLHESSCLRGFENRSSGGNDSIPRVKSWLFACSFIHSIINALIVQLFQIIKKTICILLNSNGLLFLDVLLGAN